MTVVREGKLRLRILDLFCGLGGVARGFQKYLKEHRIDFEYYAIDIDGKILLAHKLLNSDSIVIRRDAWTFTDEELRGFDFIWASPPCETHSHLNFYNWKDPKKFKEPDMRLWELIERFYGLGIPFVVENVKPYYGFIIKPSAKAGRHYLWSNLLLRSVEVDMPKFEDIKDDVEALMSFHEVSEKVKLVLKGRRLRDALRDMVYWRIAYEIAKQVIPQVLKGLTQPVLVVSSSSRHPAVREEGGVGKCR